MRFIVVGRTEACLHSRNGNSSRTQHSKNTMCSNAATFIFCNSISASTALSGSAETISRLIENKFL